MWLGALALVSCADGSGPGEGAAAIFDGIGPRDPFCTAAVLEDDEVVFAQAFGSTDEGRATVDTEVDIASVSKQFTGVAIELLIDRGELEGADLVGDLVPATSPATDDLTVDQLLTHTSGLPDYLDLLPEEYDEPTSQADAIEAIARSTPTGTEGRFDYSNSNYVVLAEVVEAVSGAPLPEFLATEVFEPLELEMVLEPSGPWEQVGDGSIQTTPTELAIWSAQYWDQTLEGPDLATVMFDPEVEEGGDAGDRYGSGISRTRTDDGAELLFHTGTWADLDTDWALLPEERLAAAVTCHEDAELPTDAPADALMELWRS